MSNSACYDLNKKCTVLKLHDMCHNPKSNCQKHITFTPKRFQLEGSGSKNTKRKMFKGTEKTGSNFFRQGLKTASPIIPAGVVAKTKNPHAGQVTSKILKQLTGGKILSLTDLHGNGLRLKVM